MTRISSRSRKLRTALAGTQTVLIFKCTSAAKNMKIPYIAHEESEQALGEHSISTSADAGIEVLEVDGYIRVLKKDALHSAVRPHQRI